MTSIVLWIITLLCLIPNLVFAQPGGGGSGGKVVSEADHPLRHRANRIQVDDAGSYYTGTDLETALQELGAGTTLNTLYNSRYLKLDGSNANTNINIGSYNLTSTGLGNFGQIRVTNPGVPDNPNAAGTAGQVSWDSSYVYVCVAANTWKRAAISTWSVVDYFLLINATDYLLINATDKLILN